MRLEPREHADWRLRLFLPLGGLLVAFVLTALLVLASGASPFSVFWLVAKGAAGSGFAALETLTRATPARGCGTSAGKRSSTWAR